MDYWIQKREVKQKEMLGEVLGIYWDEDSLEAIFKEPSLEDYKNKHKQTSFFWPFLLALKPEFIDILKKSTGRKYGIGSPEWARDDENFVDMFSWKADDFLQFVGAAVSPRVGGRQS